MAARDRHDAGDPRPRRQAVGGVRDRYGSLGRERRDTAEFAPAVTTLTSTSGRRLNLLGTRHLEPNRDHPHVPGPSLWPVGFAVGVVVLLVGLIVGWPIIILGAVLALG